MYIAFYCMVGTVVASYVYDGLTYLFAYYYDSLHYKLVPWYAFLASYNNDTKI